MAGTELDDVMAALRARPVAEDWAEILAAQKAAQAAPPPPSLIPYPVFPYGLGSGLGGVARFECQRPGCGWAVEVNADVAPIEPLILPAGFTPDDVSAALSERAAVRVEAQRADLERAFREHLGEVHPEQVEAGAH